MKFDRKIYFNRVRASLFDGSMTQRQVSGQNYKLSVYEASPLSSDLRYLSYPLATSYHETARTMWPIEEIGKGRGKRYGKPHPKTGKVYFGRGDVQLTWYENYERATKRLNLKGSNNLIWHPEKALSPSISARVLYRGMNEGWFTGKELSDFFRPDKNDPVAARIVVNNDVRTVGPRVADYHRKFLDALEASRIAEVA